MFSGRAAAECLLFSMFSSIRQNSTCSRSHKLIRAKILHAGVSCKSMGITMASSGSAPKEGVVVPQQPPLAQVVSSSMSSVVPIVLENSGLGERSFDIYSRLLRERIICVHGEVTDAMASVVTAQLLFLEAESPMKPLSMYINSPGGIITAGMAIYDTMQYVSPIVSTICMGQAASMGSLLLAGGSPGHRYSL